MPFTPMPIATRTSPLALAQAHNLQAILAHAAGQEDKDAAFPILGMSTTGDRITDRALLAAGGKGLFTKELETALLAGEARFAVHSMKDVPTRLPDGLTIAAILEREDPRDVLLVADGSARLADLPQGAVLGTASIRRQAQALAARNDLQVVLLRGNVDTRLGKLRSGEVDATFLARAGLRRLGRAEAALAPLEIDDMLPAPAQGCVGVEIRAGDEEAEALCAAIQHPDSALAAAAERGVLEALDGSCRTPIAAHATLDNGRIRLRAEALSTDGQQVWRDAGEAPVGGLEDAAELGRHVGEAIRKAGGAALAEIIAGTG
ncbi:hydroxymethylbilane synthase [Alkalicaulis satelles]|uniref:Porphobilinogen deaminase n=1 Tax=Alkalicaulis satelles TaxID=2609175 RepID=A0A5M6ZDM0_9PROT|nr:hydroxymethylbilane synthase [Alkalicaulis satelles]KAA5802310.1 hydroxymethylbilane synthase [Alkalicaulis satelles]